MSEQAEIGGVGERESAGRVFPLLLKFNQLKRIFLLNIEKKIYFS